MTLTTLCNKASNPFLLKALAKPISYSELPWDSTRAAQIRMDYDWFQDKTYDPIDYQLVFGNPNEGISFPNNQEEAMQQFNKHIQGRKTFLQQHEQYLRQRHEQYKKIL